jgi:uncharacterized protein YlxW (UPF0749 family)
VRAIWGAGIAVWLILLSGVASSSVGIGPPGAIQHQRLRNLLGSTQAELARLQSEIEQLHTDASHLEQSRSVQQREIRKSLGYAASDEIIFDFSAREGF